METRVQLRAANPITNFFRAAFERVSKPALWKRRRDLRVCESLSLGNRNFLAVVGYQNQRFLIAGTAGSISLIAELNSESPGEPAGREEAITAV